MISEKDLIKLAGLARLNLDASKIEKLRKDMNSIFDYMQQLQEIDVSAVEPMSHVHGAQNVFRDDKVLESLDIDSTLKNAPDSSGRFFRVPLII